MNHDDFTSQAAADFLDRFGRAADGVWSAPGRVNLIGEHTDYNEGFVLPFAIDRRTWAAVGLRDDNTARVTSTFSEDEVEVELAQVSPEILDGWSAYPLGIAWALGENGIDLAGQAGFDVHISSDVPVGAGLSSSAAIECAVAIALDERWQLELDRPTLARVGQLAENKAVGAPTGIMDQSASLLGRRDSAVFLDCRSLRSEIVDLGFQAAGLEIVIIDTKVSHAHATGGYAARRASCEAGAAALGVESLRDVGVADLDRAREVMDDETFRRVRHIVTENARVLATVRALRESGPLAIGEILDASHVSMRDDFEISVPELDLAVVAARAAGAIGARMTGGGFGGAAIALTPSHLVAEVTSQVAAAFAEAGYRAPEIFTVTPSDGAKREL
ncbi:galactokinase [Agreia sp. Leaf283]|uniref:galactokinase n=1 Tax=Agreia sp. Leaf283 TaxID=1736321 RepID=UPI0006F36994|nr:galactokinase [Agreia sp. Leaf283]KQP56117.1 galactokinase [Agreia sp. Leaf283]